MSYVSCVFKPPYGPQVQWNGNTPCGSMTQNQRDCFGTMSQSLSNVPGFYLSATCSTQPPTPAPAPTPGTQGAPVGASCSSNIDCANTACGRANASSGTPLTCCASGATDVYGGYDYCTGMPSGYVCWSDAMCQSNDCKDNASGFQRGRCS